MPDRVAHLWERTIRNSVIPRAWAVVFFGAALASTACGGSVRYAAVDVAIEDPGSVEAVVYLLGDAGLRNRTSEAVLGSLTRSVTRDAERGIPVRIVFLGDNIYEVGARTSHEEIDKPKLEVQVGAVPRHTNVRGVFVPGNHDWGDSNDSIGRARLETQRIWMAELADGRDVELLPSDGGYGPIVEDVDASLRLVLLDSEALLRGAQGRAETERFYERLNSVLVDAGSRPTLVISHHPLMSGGKHGGHVPFLSRFPTLSFFSSRTGVELQDLTSARYSAMIHRLEEAFEGAGSGFLGVASGHEHNLQLLRADWSETQPTYQIISGVVAKSSAVQRLGETRYASASAGFMRLAIGGGEIGLSVFSHGEQSAEVDAVFACTLRSPSGAECPEAPR